MQTYLTKAEAAEYLRKEARTLDYMRYTKKGPAFIKMGQNIMYTHADLDKWADSQRVVPGKRKKGSNA